MTGPGMAGTGMPVIAPVHPAKYDGTRNAKAVNRFLSKVDNLCFLRYPDSAVWSLVARQYLVEEAAEWYRGWNTDHERVPWEKFQEDMKNTFYPPDHQNVMLEKFENLRCEDSISSYNIQFLELMKQVSPGYHTDKSRMRCYKRGLPPKALSFVLLRDDQDLEKLMTAAQRWEREIAPIEKATSDRQNNSADAPTTDYCSHCSHCNNHENEEPHPSAFRPQLHPRAYYSPVPNYYPHHPPTSYSARELSLIHI